MDGIGTAASLIHLIGITLVGLFVFVGLLRKKSSAHFGASCLILGIYLVIVAFRFYESYPIRAWKWEGDAKRSELRDAETWSFNPATISSLHLDWPVQANGRNGGVDFWCPDPNMSCVRVPMFSDPSTGGYLEIGRDPIRKSTLLVGDERCFRDDANLIALGGESEDFFLARGVCLLAEPIEKSRAAIKFSFTQEKSRGNFLNEWRLENGAELIDRVTTGSFNRDLNEFLLPKRRTSLTRRIGDFEDGPMLAMRHWLAGRDATGMTYQRWKDAIKQRVPLDDKLMLASISGTKTKWNALRLSCTQWDSAGSALREAITASLKEQLSRAPRVEHLRACGHTSCTSDRYGLEKPQKCTTEPPRVMLPDLK